MMVQQQRRSFEDHKDADVPAPLDSEMQSPMALSPHHSSPMDTRLPVSFPSKPVPANLIPHQSPVNKSLKINDDATMKVRKLMMKKKKLPARSPGRPPGSGKMLNKTIHAKHEQEDLVEGKNGLPKRPRGRPPKNLSLLMSSVRKPGRKALSKPLKPEDKSLSKPEAKPLSKVPKPEHRPFRKLLKPEDKPLRKPGPGRGHKGKMNGRPDTVQNPNLGRKHFVKRGRTVPPAIVGETAENEMPGSYKRRGRPPKNNVSLSNFQQLFAPKY